jgi:hypothetical protein
MLFWFGVNQERTTDVSEGVTPKFATGWIVEGTTIAGLPLWPPIAYAALERDPKLFTAPTEGADALEALAAIVPAGTTTVATRTPTMKKLMSLLAFFIFFVFP